MKRVFLFIVVIILIGVVKVKSHNDYKYLLDDDTYNLYTLSFDNLSTKNIMEYFSDINVIRIYPCVNPIYKNNIGNVSYKVSSSDLSYEINLFKKNYLSLIKKNSYLDYNYLYMNGIDIEKLDVYISNHDLYNLLINTDLVVNIK